jgi:hypothetical protein
VTAPTTTSEVVVTTTSEPLPPTTSTTLPVSNIEFPLRFPADALSLSRPANTVLLDPRDGSPATEYVRFVESMQINWQYLPEVINAYPPGVHLDVVAIQDTVSKFGINYVIRGGDTYEWFHPTYEWYIPRHIMQHLVDAGGSAPITAPYVQPDGEPLHLGATAGRLDQLPGTPLTPLQCAALDLASEAHDKQALAYIAGDEALAAWWGTQVLPDQVAFEYTAASLAEEQLFTLIFTGHINLDNTTNIPLTRGVIAAHMRWHTAFNCGTGLPPDRDAIQRAMLDHAEWHFCRAIHRPDVVLRTVCNGNIDDCPRMTCDELAATAG